jgi:hypothetical protein
VNTDPNGPPKRESPADKDGANSNDELRQHATPIVAASRRQLPQAEHCDLGLVTTDDGAVGADA